jgi:hypothetical protein
MPADSKSSKAPSFYSAAADMAISGGKPGAGAGSGPDASGEETKIIATLLEVYDKWEKLTKDPKRKEKIQQLATITKEIQSGQAGGDGKPAPSADAGGGQTPEAGAGAGAGAGTGAGGAQPVPA